MRRDGYREMFIYVLLVFCFVFEALDAARNTRAAQRWVFRDQGASCRDRVANCGQLKRYNWCHYNAGYMTKHCRKTCSLCKPPQSTCVDRNNLCPSWAANRQCTKNPRYMIPNCPRSCGQCKHTQGSSCFDRHRNCGTWKRNRQCSLNRNYMKLNCAKICGFCRTPPVVNGQWGNWGGYSVCTKKCGGGVQVHYRRCNKPAPKNGGKTCAGISKQTRSCNTQRCSTAVNGNWASWGSYSPCSKTCGQGLQARYRQCSNPAPKDGGLDCVGLYRQNKNCQIKPCVSAVNGNWASWGLYSACSKTCGPGLQTRYRQCSNPAPQHGGLDCVGLYRQSTKCEVKPCTTVVDGNWGAWDKPSSCSVTCGKGTQARSRRCDNPAPQNGGKPCPGKTREIIACTLKACSNLPVHGQWGVWGTWSTCTRTCNGGHKTRYRECDDPSPSNGGRHCDGFDSENVACNTRRCISKVSLPSFTCGIRSFTGRIVGGSVADTRDWPWQAGLKRGNDDRIYCGGSLINREWVVTAAHCIYGLEPSRTGCVAPAPRLRVVLGEFDVKNVEGHEVYIDVAQVCMHANYSHRTLDYDIALLRLARPVTNFNDYIRPVCMPTSSYVVPIGKNCSVTGFGKVGEDASLSNKLRQAKVPIKRLSYCKTQYPTRTVTDRMICAGYEGGLIDSCKGDSGGPFVCQDKGNYVLAGAVSWGIGCARPGQPGLYTSIKYFLPWIQRVIKNN